ncbi:MAG TPA: prolyl oligopeptidase family serine peptidase [Sphingobacteriaceae bacterium]
MNLFKTFTLFLTAILLSIYVNAQHNSTNATLSREEKWAKISPFFLPPEEFRNDLGKYRSPLKFYDGREVRTPNDWQKRRKEILNRWTEMMGKWPPLIKNQKPEILETTRKDGYTQHRIRFNWTPTEKTKGYLLIPDGKGKKPAVITTFYEPETALGLGKAGRDFAIQLTRRGFVTLSIGTSEASEARTYSIYYPSIKNVQVQPLSMLGYAAANSWYVLSKLPEVDSKRIGIMGHSFGGKWAMFASTLFDKFACAVWSDPGIVFDESRGAVNYWEPWYLGFHPKPWRKRGMITEDNPVKGGPYSEMVASGYDLHELHALMAPRPFLVSAGSEDPPHRWVPLNHTIAVIKLLGYENRVAMTNRPEHSPNAESNEAAFLFLEYFLK